MVALDVINYTFIQAGGNQLGVIGIANRGWHDDARTLNELTIASKPPLDRRRPGLFKTDMNKGGALRHASIICQSDHDPTLAS